ncbi:unnamed protein product, partial [Symbiodinium pilosum]
MPCSSSPSACASGSAWLHCLDVLSLARDCVLSADAVGCNSAIQCCGLANSWEGSIRLLQVLEGNCGFSHRTACETIASMSHRWEPSLSLLTTAAFANVELDTAVFNAASSALAGGDEWQATLLLAAGLESLGLQPTTSTLNAVATASARGRAWFLAVNALHHLPGLEDPAGVGAVVLACAESDQWRRCLSLLQLPTMLGSESLPARNAAITTLGRQGFVVKAVVVLRDAAQMRLRPTLTSFNAALDALTSNALACSESWSRALSILQDLRSGRLPPDEFTYQFAVFASQASGVHSSMLLARSWLAKAASAFCQRLRGSPGSHIVILDLLEEHDGLFSSLEAVFRKRVQPTWTRLQRLCHAAAAGSSRLADSVLEDFFGLEGHFTRLMLGSVFTAPEKEANWISAGALQARHCLQGFSVPVRRDPAAKSLCCFNSYRLSSNLSEAAGRRTTGHNVLQGRLLP